LYAAKQPLGSLAYNALQFGKVEITPKKKAKPAKTE
jgi:hypothetical protein